MVQVQSTNGVISVECDFVHDHGFTWSAHRSFLSELLVLGQCNISSWDNVYGWWYRWLQVMKRLSHCSDNNWWCQVGLFSRLELAWLPLANIDHLSHPSHLRKGIAISKGPIERNIRWDHKWPKNVSLGNFIAWDGNIDHHCRPSQFTVQSCWLLKISFFQHRLIWWSSYDKNERHWI